MLGLGLEVGVCDAQTMKCAELQKPLSIFVHLPNPLVSKARGPRFVVCTYSGIEVTQKGKLLGVGDVADDGRKVFVELVFDFRRSCESWCVGAYKVERAFGGVEA